MRATNDHIKLLAFSLCRLNPRHGNDKLEFKLFKKKFATVLSNLLTKITQNISINIDSIRYVSDLKVHEEILNQCKANC